MRYNIKGKNLEIGERTKEKVAAKLDRLHKLFPEETVASVSISVHKLDHIIEVTIPLNKRIIRAEATENEMMAAVDKAVDILEKQIVKYKKRMLTKSRQNAAFKAEYDSITIEEPQEDHPFKIVRNKRFELRPMDSEEAVMQMELLGHDFFVFLNSATDVINVVYKRKDGTFGLIEPEY